MDYFRVCFYTLLFTLEINSIEQILENIVPVFPKFIFPFFYSFSCNFQNFVYKFEKNEKWLKSN